MYNFQHNDTYMYCVLYFPNYASWHCLKLDLERVSGTTDHFLTSIIVIIMKPAGGGGEDAHYSTLET